MAKAIYHIREFGGIDQFADENSLKPSSSPSACNMCTQGGSLSVAKGCVRHFEQPIPGSGKIHALRVFATLGENMFIAAAGDCLYKYAQGEWQCIHTYPTPVGDGKFDFVQAQLGNEDNLIIACGGRQTVKFNGVSAEPFGSEAEHSNINFGYLALYANRLFAAGDAAHPNRLYWSQLPGGGRSIESFAPVEASPNVEGGHTEVGNMQSDPITGLAALNNQLIIFKAGSIYRLLGDKPSNFIVEEVDTKCLSPAHSAVVKRANCLFFLTKEGLGIFNGVGAQRMKDAKKICRTLENCSLQNSKGALCDGKLYFTADENGSPLTIEYDLERGTYMLRRGFCAHDLCAFNGRLFIINENRRLCRLNEGATYDGAPINAHWQTPLTDLGEKGAVKAARTLYLRGSSDRALSATLFDVNMGGMVSTYRTLLPKGAHDVLEVPLKNEGRSFSLRIYNEAGGGFSLKSGIELEFDLRRRTQ